LGQAQQATIRWILCGDRELLGTAPGERADVAVGQVVGLEHGGAGIVDLIGGEGDFKPQQPAGLDEPLGMGAQFEDMAVIGAFTLEHGGGVVQPV
jgi:hypothetical protein